MVKLSKALCFGALLSASAVLGSNGASAAGNMMDGSFYVGGSLGLTASSMHSTLAAYGSRTASTAPGVTDVTLKQLITSQGTQHRGFSGEVRAGYRVTYTGFHIAADIFANKLFDSAVKQSISAGALSTATATGAAGTGVYPASTTEPTLEVKPNYMVGIRLKPGVALDDKAALYAIVGYGMLQVKQTTTGFDGFTGNAADNTSLEKRKGGLIYGLGMSYDVMPNVTVTAEYQVLDLGKLKTLTFATAAQGTAAAVSKFRIESFMVGANFHF